MKTNKSGGDMYPNHHTTNILSGRCEHECAYCFVTNQLYNNPVLKEKYSGEIELVEKVLRGNTGSGKTIFVCSCNDLFQKDVPHGTIMAILHECNRYPDNTYLFQTKNPERLMEFLDFYPPNSVFCTTIETNRQDILEGKTEAPEIMDRVDAMRDLMLQVREIRKSAHKDWQISVTIEPIFDFDLNVLVHMIRLIRPDFISIGADSNPEHCRAEYNIPEPSADKVLNLVDELKKYTEIREKKNLKRLTGQI